MTHRSTCNPHRTATAASSPIRRYATAASAALAAAAPATATVYSQTGLSYTAGVVGGSGNTTPFSFKLTGPGNATVATFSANPTVRIGPGPSITAWNVQAYMKHGASAAAFRTMNQTLNGGLFLSSVGALPFRAGAVFGSNTRTGGEFIGGVAFGTGTRADLNLISEGVFDPQALGTSTWYLMFQFTGGTHAGAYGWISVDANVVDSDNYSVTITGWAWSDTLTPLAAGSIGAVPGLGGLAGLAAGAAGLRGRRERRA